MANKFTGEVDLVLGGKPCKVVYDWRAIAEIQTQHSADLLSNLSAIDPVSMASILATGLRKHNPEITQETILDLSPPILEVQKAVDLAFAYAYYGADHFKKLPDVAPPEKSVKASKKIQ